MSSFRMMLVSARDSWEPTSCVQYCGIPCIWISIPRRSVADPLPWRLGAPRSAASRTRTWSGSYREIIRPNRLLSRSETARSGSSLLMSTFRSDWSFSSSAVSSIALNRRKNSAMNASLHMASMGFAIFPDATKRSRSDRSSVSSAFWRLATAEPNPSNLSGVGQQDAGVFRADRRQAVCSAPHGGNYMDAGATAERLATLRRRVNGVGRRSPDARIGVVVGANQRGMPR